MIDGSDPFREHPELRDAVGDPEKSVYRVMDYAVIDAQVKAAGLPDDWRYSDATREATRHTALAGHEGPLWVFGYGSLMWNPSMKFDLVRVASAPGYARHFCLYDDGARGSREHPGLMAALDVSDPGEPGCTGLAFRIPQHLIDAETYILWKREMIAPAYKPEFIEVETAKGPLRVLTFLADHAQDAIRRDIPFARQAEMIALAAGVLGRNSDYLDSLVAHLDGLGLPDPVMHDLWTRVCGLQTARPGDTSG